LTTQLANGFLLRQLVPDYMPTDEDSAGFATILEWPNLDYVPVPTRRSRRAVDQVRVSLVQYPMRPINSWEQFERQCDFFVDVAADQRADFVLFPELFTLQLLSLVKNQRPGHAARALAEMTPRYLELFAGMAVRYNVNIIGGTNFVVENDDLDNAAYLFRRDGTLARQKKIHVTPNEQRWWGVQGASEIDVFDTDCGKIAIAVCYDIEFPEMGRVVAQQGANIIFVPYNTSDRAGHLRVRYCAHARAVENQMYVVTSGCVGALPQVENADIHYAQSAVLTPSDIPFARDGIAVEASPNISTVLTCDLDLELLRRARRNGTVRTWADRRLDLYEVVYTPARDRKKKLSEDQSTGSK
jgi:predicted amidohydrolase